MTSDNAFKGSRILIVDDEEVNVVLLQRMLSRAGYGRLTATTDSREVIRLVDDIEPDLILLDLMMPSIDGYQILEALAARDRDEYLPVMVLTADVTPQALQRALRAGARDFLTKPFDQTELLLRVRNLLETRHVYQGLQRHLQTLEQLNDDAMQSIALRDQTLSAATHDIGQPLTVLRLATEVMQHATTAGSAPSPEALADDLNMIIAATSQMTDMVAELSDLARLQMGRDLVLRRSELDLVPLIREQAAAIRKSAGRRRVQLKSPDGPIIGRWDVMRLNRVVSNLLTNAVRFTSGSGVIALSLDVVDLDGKHHVQITVTDDGVGIPQDELPHIFERFYRASNVAGKIQGTGLGLASARQIVAQHGGSIDISSDEGIGTTVTVTLPFN